MARYLITSALPYINGVKHLGNLAGSMLPADVYARFQRLRGHEVLYICATDEHGTPAELAAASAGMDVKAYCDLEHDIQSKAGEGFSLSFDYFGRTSNAPNHLLTQHFAAVLEEKGLIEERNDRQVFSIDDDRFLPDRYVEGTCPHCGYERARGDQCDNCGRLLEPTDLIEPYSKISGSKNIEVRETCHLYLLQTKMEPKLREWVNDSGEAWPSLAVSIANKWLDEGLRDRSITRDLSWGVPVAFEGQVRAGFENKVFYVWFDAPIGYIGATKEWAEATGGDWERWWRTDKGAGDVTYVQFMGKDNVAFHTVSFPATILGSEETWKTVDRLKAFNWLNWYGGKFSTSEQRGVFMDTALELLPSDYWRWYLTANAPEGSDTQFTWEHFQGVVNKDLADVLGNFINRILKFGFAKFDGVVPTGGRVGVDSAVLSGQLVADLQALENCYQNMEFRKAAAMTREIWAAGNEYLQRTAPWAVFKEDPKTAGAIVREGINLCRLFAAIAQPIIPETSAKIFKSLGLDPNRQPWPAVFNGDNPNEPYREIQYELEVIKPGHRFTVPDVLFAKVDDDQVAEWAERFDGEG